MLWPICSPSRTPGHSWAPTRSTRPPEPVIHEPASPLSSPWAHDRGGAWEKLLGWFRISGGARGLRHHALHGRMFAFRSYSGHRHMTVLGSGLRNSSWPSASPTSGCARIVRGQVLVVKNEESARLFAPWAYRTSAWASPHPSEQPPGHRLPHLNIAGPIITEAALSSGGASTAHGLLGQHPPGGQGQPEHGSHVATYSVVIHITVLGINLFGDDS
jgi:hypothetical protein